MLNRRTQILFDQTMWQKINKLAKTQNISFSDLVRKTMEDKLDNVEVLRQRKEAIENTLKHRPAPFKGKIDYKEMINYGRKY